MQFFEAAKSANVTSQGGKLDFEEEIGISVSIPENAIGEEESVELFIQPVFSGPFAGREDMEPVSPAYLIKPSQGVEFKKDIAVRIQHNAVLDVEEDCEDLVFMRASSTPYYRGPLFGPLYVFHEVDPSRVTFSLTNGQFGEFKTDQFSLFQIWRRLWRKVKRLLAITNWLEI